MSSGIVRLRLGKCFAILSLFRSRIRQNAGEAFVSFTRILVNAATISLSCSHDLMGALLRLTDKLTDAILLRFSGNIREAR